MGWSSANDVIDPVVQKMIQRVENDELEESIAIELLVTIIESAQQSDWDTEDETLERFAYVPWVVEAFKACDIEVRVADEDDLRKLVRQIFDANVDHFHDLSENFARDYYAEKIAKAINPKVEAWV